MIVLTSTDTLQMKMGGAAATASPYFCGAYVDSTIAGGITADSSIAATQLNGATPVTIVAAPAAGTTRRLMALNLVNTDTAPITLTVLFGGQALSVFTLAVGDCLQYSKSDGKLSVVASNGGVKYSYPRAIVKQTVYTSGSSATHTFQAGIGGALIEGIAGGGGGGGASFSSPNMGFGAGGAAGGFFSKYVSVALTTLTYTVGGGGSAGANTGGTGGTGSDTVVVHNSVTYTAKGGLGGVGQAAGTTLDAALGGAGVAGTNGDMLSPGACGQNSVRFSGILGSSGAGAASIYGGGGAARKTNGNGNNGTGYGSGGGGAAAVSASTTGGLGAGGIVIITEYA
jgi:hypothetical protein